MTAPTNRRAEGAAVRFVFLDVDGVCNSMASMSAYHTCQTFDQVAVRLLERASIELDFRFVLSSAWRFRSLPKCRAIFTSRGFDVIAKQMIGYTDDGPGPRGAQIKRWLDGTAYGKDGMRPVEYAIIDDDSDMLPEQLPRFVKTSFLTGFRFQEYAQLCELFDPAHQAVTTMRGWREYAPLEWPDLVPSTSEG